MSIKVNGVVDRISDGQAVILVESHGIEIVRAIDPEDAPIKAGDWLDLVLTDTHEVVEMSVNTSLTKERTEKVESIMQRLQKRKASKFKS